MDKICIHEAGHAVVLKREMGKVPVHLHYDPKTSKALTSSGLALPQNGHDATRFAAYFFGGAAAVSHAKATGDLPDSTDPMIGYAGPPGSGADLDLVRQLGDRGADLVGARGCAEDAVRQFWDVVLRIASQLQDHSPILQPELAALLANVPQRT